MEYALQTWAAQQWAGCDLGDVRRTQRALEMGRRMAAQPDKSLPQQMGDRAALVASYRLLNNPAVSLAALLAPHCAGTLARSRALPVVLFIQDRTTLDYSHHPATTGLGPISSAARPHGFLLHSTLAVNPAGAEVLGLAHVQCLVRPTAAPPPPINQRRGRPEGQAWETAVNALGAVPADTHWVYVSDRESDIYEYFTACLAHGAGFVARLYQNRVLADAPDATPARLLDAARQWAPAPGSNYTVTVPATKQAPKRIAQIQLSWQEVTIQAPRYVKDGAPCTFTVVRAWEPEPPPGAEPVEWVLATSETITTLADAQRVVTWYECRWLIEDFHQCLKTGCRVEEAQLDDGQDLQRLLGFILPIATRLLQLRQTVRVAPETPASAVVGPERVRLLAAHFKRPPVMTVAEFWKQVARLGGHQGRKADGPPGWRTLWRGWLQLEQWLYATQLLT